MAAGLLFAWPALARADDWLALWPECSMPDASRPQLTLLYPAPGLPAVVQAGQALVVRVRTRAALTPPPGVQQQTSLNFMAELSAAAPGVDLPGAIRHRHALPVVSMRPDGRSSLVYRVRLQIPAYLAEGTYTLWLRTQFGVREADRAVRVIGGQLPRLARLPEGLLLPPLAAASWPVDVWLAGDAPPLAASESDLDAASALIASAPTLRVSGPALALRVGKELWVRSGCADPRAFEREIANLLAAEGLHRVELKTLVDRAAPPPSAAELTRSPRLAIAAGSVQLDNRDRAQPSELPLLLPFAPGVKVDAGTFQLFPASEPSAAAPLAKLARWRVPAGAIGRLTLAPSAADDELRLSPDGVRSGQPAHLEVQGAGSGARVAYVLGFARSAYGTRELRTSFAGPLAHPVQAQVFAAGGTGQVAHGHLWVEPYRPPNCAIRGLSPDQSGRRSPRWAIAAAVLLFARARRSAKKARALGRSE